MFGKVTVKTITYQSFTRQLRKRIPGLDKAVIYREWNRESFPPFNVPLAKVYDRIAARLKRRGGI